MAQLDIKDYVIFYKDDIGLVLCNPNPNSGLNLLQVANQDVPKGAEYKFVKREDIPKDLKYLGAWEVDFSKSDGISSGERANKEF
jgi:hypothetical protein